MSVLATFTDTSTPGPSGPIVAWAWDFGDGGTSTSQNPTHTYASYGTYTVRLTITGSGNDGTAGATQTVTLLNPATLTAAFSDSISGLVVTFADGSSPGPSGPITAWAWNFGDSATSTAKNPTHTYASAGTYTVSLTVTGTSPDGTAGPVTHNVTVSSPAPSGLKFGMYNNCAVPSATEADTAANWKAVRDTYVNAGTQWRREFNSGLPASYSGGDVPYGIKTFLSFKSPFADVLSGSSRTAIQNFAKTWPSNCYATWEHEPDSPVKEFVADPHNNFVIPFQTIYGWVKAVRPDVQFGPVYMAFQWYNGGESDPGSGNATRWVIDSAHADFYGVDWYNKHFNPVNWNFSNATDWQNWYGVVHPLGKPLVVGEFGIEGTTSGGKNDADTVTIINGCRAWVDAHPEANMGLISLWNGINTPEDHQLTPTSSDHTGRPLALAAWNAWVNAG